MKAGRPARSLAGGPDRKIAGAMTLPFGSAASTQEAGNPIRIFVPGTPIGKRFAVREVLGSGGNAVVYRAFDREAGCLVALKVLKRPRLSDRMWERFSKELLLVEAARDPHLVPVLSFGRSGDTVYLATPDAPVETLRARLAKGLPTRADALTFGEAILESLAALHALGVVHRDLKPGNILLDDTGAVRLTDYGLSRLWAEAEAKASDPTLLAEAAEYMAPEQALGDAPDEATDLYAFGVILFEMLTGHVPFSAPSSVGTVVAHLREAVPDLKRLAGTPVWLAEVVTRLLCKDPARRYTSAAEVLADLRRRRATPEPGLRLRRLPPVLATSLLLFVGLALIPPWPWMKPRFQRVLGTGPLGIEAVDSGGETLWSRPDVAVERHAIVRTRGGRRVAAIMGRSPSGESGRLLCLLDEREGRVVESLSLPAPPETWPGSVGAASPTRLFAVDLNGDALDELLITYETEGAPKGTARAGGESAQPVSVGSYHVLSPLTEGEKDAALIFAASARFEPVAAVDLDGDGLSEVLLVGHAAGLGGSPGLAAVRVPQPSRRRPESPSRRLLAGVSPDLSVSPEPASALLWFALLPRAMNLAGLEIEAREKDRALAITFASGVRRYLDYDGFGWMPERDEEAKLSRKIPREEARDQSFARLREVAGLREAAQVERAVEGAREALLSAQLSGDPLLVEWASRVLGTSLARAGQLEEASRLFEELFAQSPAVRDGPDPVGIAQEAARGFLLAGRADEAVLWFRRGSAISKGSAQALEILEGEVLALSRGGFFEQAATAIDRFEARFPDRLTWTRAEAIRATLIREKAAAVAAAKRPATP